MVKNNLGKVTNLLYPPAVCLLYHRVAPIQFDPFQLCVSPENFEKQIKFLSENFPLQKFSDLSPSRNHQNVSITFDDGYYDNLVYALPILEKYKVHATIFISTQNINTDDWFWWDILAYIAQQTENQIFYDFSFHQRIKFLSIIDRNTEIENLIKQHNIQLPRNPQRLLTNEEILKLDSSDYISLGAHTHSHTALSSLSKSEQKNEIVHSKQFLEKLLQKEISLFAYPFGGKIDYNNDSISLVQELGFSKVAANFQAPYRSFNSDFEIPRQLVRDWDLAEFTMQMSYFWNY